MDWTAFELGPCKAFVLVRVFGLNVRQASVQFPATPAVVDSWCRAVAAFGGVKKSFVFRVWKDCVGTGHSGEAIFEAALVFTSQMVLDLSPAERDEVIALLANRGRSSHQILNDLGKNALSRANPSVKRYVKVESCEMGVPLDREFLALMEKRLRSKRLPIKN